MEMIATRYAKLRGRQRTLHLCPSVNGVAWDSLCGRKAPWPWSINRPWTLGNPICKLCVRKEAA
ncbi:hypothetical protein LCGC14_1912220 [marine sediment metagenome]|uniref:Uncharacterized protein n=1 Tax=marine sediment metagenome TaxID=412755 RepID=A0A0F9FT55_9ZZZZ